MPPARSSDLGLLAHTVSHCHQCAGAGEPHTVSSTEALMTTNHSLTRRERLGLTGAALRGIFAGAARALLDWAINNLTN